VAIRRFELTGTKNGVNDAFTIPVAPIANSEQVIFNGSILKPVVSFTVGAARNLECIISGQNVQVGLPPNSGDTLWILVDVTL
jgi:hypothetical protein